MVILSCCHPLYYNNDNMAKCENDNDHFNNNNDSINHKNIIYRGTAVAQQKQQTTIIDTEYFNAIILSSGFITVKKGKMNYSFYYFYMQKY